MKNLGLLIFTLFATSALAFPPKTGPKYETDSATVGFLRRYLISGGDLFYPSEAAKLKQEGSGFFLMELNPDGSVSLLAIKMSTGHPLLDEHVARTLKAYRFKQNTKGPLMWLVSFAQPATVIVKAYRAKPGDRAPVLFGRSKK